MSLRVFKLKYTAIVSLLTIILTLLSTFGTLNSMSVCVHASPLNYPAAGTTEVDLHNRGSSKSKESQGSKDSKTAKVAEKSGEMLLGYRVVSKSKAKEYNKAKTLTAIPAGSVTLIEGAYLAPQLGVYSAQDSYECVIYVATRKLENQKLNSMLFVDSSALHDVKKFVEDNGFKPESTILFSHYSYPELGIGVQGVIPSKFLVKSPSNPNAEYGSNSLRMRVQCFESGLLPRDSPISQWEHLPVHAWPQGLTTEVSP